MPDVGRLPMVLGLPDCCHGCHCLAIGDASRS